MTMLSEAAGDNREWLRLSPWALIFFLLLGLRGLLQQGLYVLAPLVLALYNFGGSGLLLIAALALLAIVLLTGWLRYRRFRFRFLVDRLEVRQGLLRRSQTDLHYHRVQNLSIDSPWYYRPLQLVTLRVDTAGSAAEEVSLAAITEQQAEQFRGYLFRRSPAPLAEACTQPQADEPATPAQTPLHVASIADLLLFGLANSRVFWVLAIVASLLGNRFAQRFMEQLDNGMAARLLGWIESPFWQGLLLLAVMLLLLQVLIAGSLLLTVSRYYRFSLFQEGSRFRSLAGLFSRHGQTLRRDRIQNVVLDRPLLHQWRQRTTLRCQQATDLAVAQAPQEGGSGFLVPAMADGRVPALLALFCPQAPSEPPASAYCGVHPRVWRAPVIAASVLLLMMLGGLWPSHGGVPLLATLTAGWLLVIAASRRRWRWWGVCLRSDHLFVRKGWLGSRVTLLALFRVQGVQLQQSPVQRWLGLADLQLSLASGNLRVPSLPLAQAQQIADLALYHAARRRHGWI